jgi:hypothetical protein
MTTFDDGVDDMKFLVIYPDSLILCKLSSRARGSAFKFDEADSIVKN